MQKKISSKQNLETHQRGHEVENKEECSICFNKFTNLKRHELKCRTNFLKPLLGQGNTIPRNNVKKLQPLHHCDQCQTSFKSILDWEWCLIRLWKPHIPLSTKG